jgi:hypothetical protein
MHSRSLYVSFAWASAFVAAAACLAAAHRGGFTVSCVVLRPAPIAATATVSNGVQVTTLQWSDGSTRSAGSDL